MNSILVFKETANKFLNNKFNQIYERKSELAKLTSLVEHNNKVILFGESGNGKSTLACQYAFNTLKNQQYSIIKWIDASFEPDIPIQLNHLLIDLNNSLGFTSPSASSTSLVNTAESSPVDQFKQTINRYHQHDRVLLILDNVTSVSDVNNLLDGFSSNVKVILTTRFDLAISDSALMFVDKLTLSQAYEMILQQVFLKDAFKPNEWFQILETISQLTANERIAPLELSSLFNVLSKYREMRLDDTLDYLNANFKLIEYEHSNAFDMLLHLAYLNCDKIYYGLLMRLSKVIHISDLNEVLDYLESNMLIQKCYNGYRMHETTQAKLVKLVGEREYLAIVMEDIVLAVNERVEETWADVESGYETIVLRKQADLIQNVEWSTKYLYNEYHLFKNVFGQVKQSFSEMRINSGC